MNIEELELSLRTEFEGQVRHVLAGIKRDVEEFHSKFRSELDEHRNRLEQAIVDLSSQVPENTNLDAAFSESVAEHLRLARDDGAQVAAIAFGEAEKLRLEAAAAQQTEGFEVLRDAIADISSKNSQATILQSLVANASRFATRGAFFIVKNDQFVGWKVFGSEAGDAAVRDLLLPASSDTLLSASIRSMAKVSSSAPYSQDGIFLDPLQFGVSPEMHAFPLVARGRGVAVLYADAADGGKLNADAIETLVRVAGITVELLAAAGSQQPAPAPAPAVEEKQAYEPAESQAAEAVEAEPAYQYDVPAVQTEQAVSLEAAPAAEPAYETPADYSYSTGESVDEAVVEYTGEVIYESGDQQFETEKVQTFEAPVAEAPVVETFEPAAEGETTEPATENVSDFAFVSNGSYDSSYETETEPAFSNEVPTFEAPVTASLNGHAEVATIAEPAVETVAEPAVETVVEPVVEVAAAEPKRSRFSERNVDLPIEVAEEERKLHNDARRFARLLVSEIKLYNEQKVADGRESGNLYEQLKEAIDRSREMYDKRVQPAVASKFDYFHYEVVNSLAEGQDTKLGAGYPGATV